MRSILYIFVIIALWASPLHFVAYGQEEGDAADASADVPVDAPASPLELARAKGGDILVMKSGVVMGGVQIIRSSPLVYEVELISGMDPMVIPRRHVERVEYDDIDPLREKRLRDQAPKLEIELIVDGKELDPEFEKKLKQPVPGTPLEYKEVDYVQVLRQLAQKTNVTITIAPDLKQDTVSSRLWTITITPGMTLLEVLQKHWSARFKSGKVTYERDKVVLKKKNAEPTSEAASANRIPVIKLGR